MPGLLGPSSFAFLNRKMSRFAEMSEPFDPAHVVNQPDVGLGSDMPGNTGNPAVGELKWRTPNTHLVIIIIVRRLITRPLHIIIARLRIITTPVSMKKGRRMLTRLKNTARMPMAIRRRRTSTRTSRI